MSVIKIDPVTNDIVFVDGVMQFVDGEQQIRQGVDVRLKTFLGERPWDKTGVGTNYLDLLFRKGVPEAAILGELRRRIMSQPGMVEVLELEATLVEDRRLRVDWSGLASVGLLGQQITLTGSTEIQG